MRIKPVIVSLCAAAMAIAPAPLAAKAAPSEPAAKSKPTQKLICRDLETTGTRFKDRVCLTKEEWKEVDRIR